MVSVTARAFAQLRDSAATREQLLSFYDSLAAVEPQGLFGVWTGGDWRTGGRFDGLLGKTSWWGKAFRSENDVDALIFSASLRPLALINTLMIWPFRLPERRELMRHPLGRARIREVRFRGVVSAAMCYNHMPIIDHFRRVDDDTVMGIMDFCGRRSYELFFWLRRAE